MPRWLKIVLGVVVGLAVVIGVAVSGTLTSSTGGVIPIEYQLVKENDAWKILNIDLTVH